MKAILCVRWRLGLEVVKFLHKNNTDLDISILTDTHEIIYFCKQNNLHCINTKSNSFLDYLNSTEYDFLISCMFNKILPKSVLEKAKLGSINIHQSLLPKYRGRSPLIEAIMNHESFIGYTIHYMDEKVDNGNIIYQCKWLLDYDSTLEDIMDQYVELVPIGLKISMDLVKKGHLGVPQNPKNVTFCSLDSVDYNWDKPIKEWAIKKGRN